MLDQPLKAILPLIEALLRCEYGNEIVSALNSKKSVDSAKETAIFR